MNEQDIYMEQEQEYVPQEADRYAPVSTKTFFYHKMLYSIPVIGWILCLVFAFTQKNVNKRNFARASLIGLLIGLVMLILVAILVISLAGMLVEELAGNVIGSTFGDMDQLTEILDELQDGKYDDAIQRVESGEFGQHPELSGLLEEVKKGGVLIVLEQVQNGGFEDVMQKYAEGAYDQLLDKAQNGDLGDLGALGDLIGQVKNGNLSGIPDGFGQ